MMKFLLLIFILLIISSSGLGQKKNRKQEMSFKVVGYYFLNAAIRDTIYADSSYLFLNKITHLNIAFINPDSAGHFKQDLAIDTLIQKAHKKNVKVLASIAGGGRHPYYAGLLRDDKRKLFVNNLVSLLQKYNLDGIDVDIEGNDIDENYQNFVIELAAVLRPQKKLITAAIATVYKDQLPDNALKQFDFVNVMSYDRTGPWRPDRPGDHSPYLMAVEDLDYWHKIRSIPKEKLVLGLPFYGYGFVALDSPVVSMNYKQIVSLYPNNLSDTLSLPGNMVMYFNNMGTIKKKTKLAMKEAGGVMIWQLLGDADGEHSLLNNIYQVIHNNLKKPD
jgi:chitinase